MTALTRMRWWHIDQVVPLERRLFGVDSWTARAFWSELGQLDTRHFLVVVDDDQVVGYGGLCAYPDEGFIQTIGVAPEKQGEGLGGLLLQALLDEAARRRKATVSLEVRADNEAAQRLYKRFGFRAAGVRRGYYQPSGTDALVMMRP